MEVKELRTGKRPAATKDQRLQVEEKTAEWRKNNEKITKGYFEFVGVEGGFFEFCYRLLKGDPFKTIRINNGEICEMEGFAKDLLNNTYRKIMNMPPSDYDKTRDAGRTYQKFARVRFIPVELLSENIVKAT